MEVGISEEQVAIAKRSLLVEHLGDMKSNMSLARQFATSQLLYGAWDASLDWLEQVVSLEPSEVLVEAQRILKRDNRTVGILQTEAS
jgi:predicted Zn-dependent peptidase